jgi:hypothetical protein
MSVKTMFGPPAPSRKPGTQRLPLSSRLVIGVLFLLALVAFEIFNFDTTRFALQNFLGTVSFAGVRWAVVLALAFCAIDLAGLLRFFLPEEEDGGGTPTEVWYLMGAWLLGATMNALMTWWAVSLTLLNHELGNEVLSRQQLLNVVPVFVAVLVWLTRILFIGAFTVAGGSLFNFRFLRARRGQSAAKSAPATPVATPLRLRRQPRRTHLPDPAFRPVTEALPPFLVADEEQEAAAAPETEVTTVGADDVLPWPTVRRRRPSAMHAGGD